MFFDLLLVTGLTMVALVVAAAFWGAAFLIAVLEVVNAYGLRVVMDIYNGRNGSKSGGEFIHFVKSHSELFRDKDVRWVLGFVVLLPLIGVVGLVVTIVDWLLIKAFGWTFVGLVAALAVLAAMFTALYLITRRLLGAVVAVLLAMVDVAGGMNT